jgi:hypothetical protein
MGVAPDSLAMTTVNFGAPLQLRAGMRYWIGLHPAASQPTDLGWWWNLAEGQLQSQVWQSNTPTKVLMGQGWERSHLLIEPAYQLNALADSDGDGVPDSRDACPDRFGEPENNGCPTPITDRDGDEIPDNLDACPDEHGRAAHNGCPPPRPPRPPTTDLVTLRATFNGIPWPDISGLVSFWRVGASALITNLGPATARNFSVEFEFRPVAGGSGGRHQQSVSVSELRPGESMWVNTPQDPLNRGTMFIWPGAYTLTAFVDPSLRIAETDESNNVYVTPAFLPK